MKSMVYRKTSQKRELVQLNTESTDRIKGNDVISRKATNSFLDIHYCAYRKAEVVLNSNHCNINEN